MRIEQRNLFEAEHTPKVDLFARAELSLWGYGVLAPELWPMAERLKARFQDGLVYAGPHRAECECTFCFYMYSSLMG